MATGTLVSEEEYLHTSYEPDCEYKDGVLEERNLGTPPHSKLQYRLAGYFYSREKEWGFTGATEARYRIREGRYLIPDLAVAREIDDSGKAITDPPLIWIEILSPEDRYS